MIPVLLGLLPSLIGGAVKVAEIAFPKGPDGASRGAEKKSFAMDLVTTNFELLERHGMLPNAIAEHREVALSLISLAIDGAAAALKKARDPAP